jgi:hypothetical protein
LSGDAREIFPPSDAEAVPAREPDAWIRVEGDWRRAWIKHWLRLGRAWGVWVQYEHPEDGKVWGAFAYSQETIRPRGPQP